MEIPRLERLLTEAVEVVATSMSAVYLREAGAQLVALEVLAAAALGLLVALKLRVVVRAGCRRPRLRQWPAAPEASSTSCTDQYLPIKAQDGQANGKTKKYPTIDIVAVAGPRLTGLLATAPARGAVAVRLINSLDLSAADVRRLQEELAEGPRNRFVCLQLASMAQEQLAAVAAATIRGNRAYLHAAGGMHFAQVEVEGSLVAAALFYPRTHSRCRPAAGQQAAGRHGCQSGVDAIAAAAAVNGEHGSWVDPHCYIEMLCTSQPGRGWGSLLLHHIEQHAKRHAAGSLAVGGRPLQSIKLLSIESAQRFYSRNGYSEPDGCSREMHKLLADVGSGRM